MLFYCILLCLALLLSRSRLDFFFQNNALSITHLVGLKNNLWSIRAHCEVEEVNKGMPSNQLEWPSPLQNLETQWRRFCLVHPVHKGLIWQGNA